MTGEAVCRAPTGKGFNNEAHVSPHLSLINKKIANVAQSGPFRHGRWRQSDMFRDRMGIEKRVRLSNMTDLILDPGASTYIPAYPTYLQGTIIPIVLISYVAKRNG